VTDEQTIERLEDADREQLRAAFQDVALHRLLDIRPVRVDGELVIFEMPVREEAFNPSGNLHGGALATLVDVAAGTAAALNSAFEPGVNTIVTADMHVRYLGRPKGDVVRAEAHVLRAGRQVVVVECQVLDSSDRLIVAADFSSMVVPLRGPLRPEVTGDPNTPDL
jgi:uncharacterized protein (TIGR00369 family)